MVWNSQFRRDYGWKILDGAELIIQALKLGQNETGFTKAIKYWVPSIAVSAITIYREKLKQWNGDTLITSLESIMRKINLITLIY